MVTSTTYLHGYSETEQERLFRQALFLEERVFRNTDFSNITQLLEVGCGVGAETAILLRRAPHMHITGIDLSEKQLQKARIFLAGIENVSQQYSLQQADAARMNFTPGRFDGAFLCWILEHVNNPIKVLQEVKRVLAPGSKIFISEVFNSSFFISPAYPNATAYWNIYNQLQRDTGGHPDIGTQLGFMLRQCNYVNIQTYTETFLADDSNPTEKQRIINYWTELMMSAKPSLLASGYANKTLVEKAKEEMELLLQPGGMFFCSFIRASAQT